MLVCKDQRSETHPSFLQESGVYCKNAKDVRFPNMGCIVIKNQSDSFCPFLPCSFSFLLCSFHSSLSLIGFCTQPLSCGHDSFYKIIAPGANQLDFLAVSHSPLISRERKCDWFSLDKVIIPLFWGWDLMVYMVVSSRLW